MKTEEARKKTCPFFGPVKKINSLRAMINPLQDCVAPRCMAWEDHGAHPDGGTQGDCRLMTGNRNEQD
ncbi:hypothetical protein KAR91_22250 [Candidatus Pacearchaeota archaeon]|nr:hypothetical protein [Candidatus Pacearchaeota archaeon]